MASHKRHIRSAVDYPTEELWEIAEEVLEELSLRDDVKYGIFRDSKEDTES
mgnify:CR=1 FL=1